MREKAEGGRERRRRLLMRRKGKEKGGGERDADKALGRKKNQEGKRSEKTRKRKEKQ